MRKLAAAAAATAAVGLFSAPAAGAAVESVFGGDVACMAKPDGTRFCGGSMSTTKTFDGVPIDVNVAFPDGRVRSRPLVMLFHGYGGEKLGLDQMQRWVDRGYIAFSMSDRGFGDSCGSTASRLADPAGCAQGWVHLLDTRYEVRDAQLFAGELVDEGLAKPRRIGAIGGSYGGGLSLALAALRDRTMLPGGGLVPWRSPEGTRLKLSAAAPDIPWSDLAYSLLPNGGTLDYVADSPYEGRIGVMKKTFVTGLYASGQASGYYAPAGADPDADLSTWYARINAGEPYDGDPTAEGILDEVISHHSSYYIDHSRPPAPVLLTNGFTDDLFPVDEGVRFYNRTRQQYPHRPIALYFADRGHMRGQNKDADVARVRRAQERWLDHFVLGEGRRPYLGVRALTQTCPASEPSAGPYRAHSWARLARGEVRYRSRAAREIAPSVVDPAGRAFDPVVGPGACAQAPADDVPGAASYRLHEAPRRGYTLLGSPTVIAKIASPGANSQLAARLVDIDPDGQETLVARGLLRPDVGEQATKQVFQLHGNGWRFEAGHMPKLELLPTDSPYGRESNGQEPITVSHLHLRLPVHERPHGKRSVVKERRRPVVLEGMRLSRDFKRLFARGRGGGR